MSVDSLSVGMWNTQWKVGSSIAGKAMSNLLLSQSPDVVCITEGHLNQLQPDWHVCSSAPDYGYLRNHETQRKVILFSRNPWRDIDPLGSDELPPGRFVSATTDTKIGPMCFVGLCVPWRDAHVSSGSRNRKPWQDHKNYLKALRAILERMPTDSIVLGDFNQRQPRHRQPIEVEKLLLDAIGNEFLILTSGIIPDVQVLSIDHFVCRPSLQLKSLKGLPNIQGSLQLSDHVGLVIEVERATNYGNV
jgi:endonuclease/exonuclease/phosphatase family metal-dependent hydrolase